MAAAWMEERLIGLAPFYLEKGENAGRLLQLGIGTSDYLDLLLDPQADEALAGDLALRIAQSAPGWDEWELTELPPWASAKQLPCPAGCDEVIEPASQCYAVEIAPRRRELSALLPKVKQRKLRMARRRSARRGELCILTADKQNVAALVDELVRLNRLRQATLGHDDIFADPRLGQFLHKSAEPLLMTGILRLYALMIGSDLVAVYHGLQHAGRTYCYLSGFDPAYAFESSGSVLLASVIEQALVEGATQIDFLRGSERYKAEWGAAPRRNQRRLFRRQWARHVAA
ncbi:MAG TPA: GNAT family N-acetyltransferase [Ferrovibrio sp.]|uniref:GNAT family N-acetyltransferase n=1 Tax=Ferrovibrio sp. TaxID=1917215 RepID=UPI002ED494CB